MSIQRTTDGDGTVLATFRLPAQAQARTVHVVGEFNDWSRSAHPMVDDGGGFVARVPLQPGRRYRFRYLIDGERWENDWAADDYVDNDFGGTDSVLDLAHLDPDGAASPPARPAQVTESDPQDDGVHADGGAAVESVAGLKARPRRKSRSISNKEAMS